MAIATTFDAVHSCIKLFTSTWRTVVGAEGLFPQTTLHMLTAQTTYSQVWAILVIPLGLQNDWDLMQGQQNIYKDGRKGPTRKLYLLWVMKEQFSDVHISADERLRCLNVTLI